jgi:putative ABC transport system permease protein
MGAFCRWLLPVLRGSLRKFGTRSQLDGAVQDLRFSVRGFLRAPRFFVAAIAILAFGTGASTAIFSIVYGMAIRPLPYSRPDRLVRIYESNPANGQLKLDVSIGTFHEWRQSVSSIESIALVSIIRNRFLDGAEQVPVATMRVSPSFFDVLGIPVLLGRNFKAESEYAGGGTDEVVISYGAWQRLFGGRPDVVERVLVLSGAGDADSFRIVGVMPKGFYFDQEVDVWFPLIVRPPIAQVVRNWRYDRVIARLRHGATIDETRTQLESIAARLAQEYPASNRGWTATLELLHDSIIGNFKNATFLLLASVAIVLFLTSLSVGGLVIARAIARQRETAVRIALGAGLARLVRLYIADALLINTVGISLGVLAASVCLQALKAIAPEEIPRLDVVEINGTALTVAALAGIIGTTICTLAPLGRAQSRDLDSWLHASFGSGENEVRGTTRAALITAQCACAAMLIALALMLTRSLVNMNAVDLGWNPAGVLSMSLSPPMPRQLRNPAYLYVEWSDRLIEQLEEIPGVERAAVATQDPFSPETVPAVLARGRRTGMDDGDRWPVIEHIVTDGYFELMNISVIRGRTFARNDRFSESQLVSPLRSGINGSVVISQSVAHALWPGRPAVGETLWLPSGDTVESRQVVGIVEDLQYRSVGEVRDMHVFVPWTQRISGRPRLFVKATSEQAALIGAVNGAVHAVQPGTQIDQVTWLRARVARSTAERRFTSVLFVAFAILAVILASSGLSGMLSYLVSVRRREIGIRLALGASRVRIVAQVFAHGVAHVLLGTLIGIGGAVVLARMSRSLLFGIEPLDVFSYLLAIVLLIVVSTLATLGPAHRAARLDPSSALRSE